jgi:2-polyprenylphenol 6-hydroxylase
MINCNSTHQHVDIAIVGGGMVGASIAILLAKRLPQQKIALIESQSAPIASAAFHVDARSTALSYGTKTIFDELEIGSEIASHATAIKQVHVSDRGHFLGNIIDAETYQLDAVGYVVENPWLIHVLQQHLLQQKNLHCFYNTSAKKMTFFSDAAQLTLDNAQTLTAELVIIADGSESPLRHSLGIATQIQNYQQAAVITNLEFSQPHNGVAYERFTDEGPIALLPLGESANAHRAALVWTLPATKAQEIHALSDHEFLAQLQKRFGFRVGFFERVSTRVVYPLQLVLAEEQIRSRLVLIGNAAHFLHPVAGQGFNLALRDCVCLADTLREAVANKNPLGDLSVLQHYLARQAVDQQLTVSFSDKLVRLFSNKQLPLIALRHLGLLSFELFPFIKNSFTEQTMGMAGRKW